MQQSAKRRAARSPVVRETRKHLGLVLAVLTIIVVFALMTSRQFNAGNFLASWNGGAVVYIGFTWYRMLRSNVNRIRQRAADTDFSDILVLCLSIAAAVASIAGIGIELSGVKNASPEQVLESAGTAFFTIIVSWVFLHTLFTTHYAHRFYADDSGKPPIRFPDDVKEPNYWDFLYFTFTIGVASQTADVAIATTSMRKMALLHSVLSFLFNTTILALAINVGASLL